MSTLNSTIFGEDTDTECVLNSFSLVFDRTEYHVRSAFPSMNFAIFVKDRTTHSKDTSP